MREKLCLALDVDNTTQAERFKQLSSYIGVFKIGSQLFTSEGPKIVEAVQKWGGEVFLDLKFHDIPNTVANAAREVVKLGVFMLNIHAMGGYEMMHSTAQAVREEAEKLKVRRPLVLAVTVLTSINDDILNRELKISSPMENYVFHLAKLAQSAGLDGVVASPKEIKAIREACGESFVILTPGIRPVWSGSPDDQKRTTTPKDAMEMGADYIVIGRPILSATDPVKAAQMVLKELDSLK